MPSLRGSKAPWPAVTMIVRVSIVLPDAVAIVWRLVARRELAHLLAEEDVGAELEALLGAEVDERLALDLRMAGDVVDVLLRVDGRDLAAELLEALEDADRRLAMAGVVGSREADGPGADDRDVVDHVRPDAS